MLLAKLDLTYVAAVPPTTEVDAIGPGSTQHLVEAIRDAVVNLDALNGDDVLGKRHIRPIRPALGGGPPSCFLTNPTGDRFLLPIDRCRGIGIALGYEGGLGEAGFEPRLRSDDEFQLGLFGLGKFEPADLRLGSARFGRLDCAHNNAGISEQRVTIGEMTEEVRDLTININLKGVWLCMKQEILQMAQQGGGAIVNTSSVVGLAGVRFQPAYVASKHGVVGLTKAAALDYARDNIRVNSVCPGPILTPSLESYVKENPEVGVRLRDNNPSGRFGTPEEVAQTVVWLCSEQSSYITGHSLAVDGGVLAK